MVARGDADRLAERHVDDALRGVPSVQASARSLCDLGSGGGLPGVVLAIALPRVHVTLAERRRNRSTFLELVVRELQLENVSVYAGDARQLPAAAFDVCTARAFADASATWAVAEPLLTIGGRLLYWAGSSFDVAAAVVPGARLRASEASEVAGSGPVVIMTRQ
jgi:16S rRNA (guanine527-N7)-methyltransferase